MKKILKIALFLSILLIACSSTVFAASGNDFTNFTEFVNNTYVVRYGSILTFTRDGTITSNDTAKAVVKNRQLFITGTGPFTVELNLTNGGSETLNFYSWNATADVGRYWIYTDANLINKESIVYPQAYLELSGNQSSKSFQIISHLFSTGRYSRDLNGKYIENRSNELSYYNYSFDREFNDAFEPIILPPAPEKPPITGNEFINITRFYNNTYIVKYGTVIRLISNGSLTSSDTNKAEVVDSKLVKIKGTGNFKLTWVNGSQSLVLNFFSWNGYMQSGAHPTYLDVNRIQESDTLFAKVYLDLDFTSVSDTFKIKDYFFIDGTCDGEGVVKDKFLKSYSGDPNSRYIYSFGEDFDNIPPEQTTAPIDDTETPPDDYFYDLPEPGEGPSPITSPINRGFLELAKECIMWLSQNGYQYVQGNAIPLYSSGGIPSSSWVPKSRREVDCSAYVSWVLYEYGRRNNVSELTNTFKTYQKNSAWFHGLATDLKNGKTNGYRQYFELVWHTNRDTSDRSYIKSICRPGDILIYRKKVGHVELFVGGWSGNTCQIYNCGIAPAGKYNSGNPRTRNMGSTSGHGFWDLSSIIRLKGSI